MNPERRTWDTPLRRPWNPVIKACLNAIDEHVRLYLETHDTWHMKQAQILRTYVTELKEWIHGEEGKNV
jgi:hypothetical protein